MKIKMYRRDKYEKRSVPSLGLCIYCGLTLPHDELTDEHIIPYALGHNTLTFKDSSCKSCAAVIQRYEQEVLKKQLGKFRLQVDAPSRTKNKDRPKHVEFSFVAVGLDGKVKRDLGSRSFAIEEAPLVLNLWSLPEARITHGGSDSNVDGGQPWTYCEASSAYEICRKIAKQTGEPNVAMKLGDVNRNHFLRFLAKMAHAYAVAELGMDGFEPFLNDIILNKSNDLAMYVGGILPPANRQNDPAETILVCLGRREKYVVVLLQFYPFLGAPAYGVVVGKQNNKTEQRIEAMAVHYI